MAVLPLRAEVRRAGERQSEHTRRVAARGDARLQACRLHACGCRHGRGEADAPPRVGGRDYAAMAVHEGGLREGDHIAYKV